MKYRRDEEAGASALAECCEGSVLRPSTTGNFIQSSYSMLEMQVLYQDEDEFAFINVIPRSISPYSYFIRALSLLYLKPLCVLMHNICIFAELYLSCVSLNGPYICVSDQESRCLEFERNCVSLFIS